MSNPYESPYRSRLPLRTAMPGVVKGYIAFCIFTAVALSGYVLMGICLMVFSEQLAEWDREVKEPMAFVMLGGCTSVAFAPFVLLNLLGLCFRKGKFGYVFGAIVIITGLLYCVPLAAVLLVFWFQPQTKAYFGVAAR